MIVDTFCSSPIGGAGNAANNLHQGLLSAGVTSRFWHAQRAKLTNLDHTYQPLEGPDSHETSWTEKAGLVARSVGLRVQRWQAKYQRPAGFDLFTDPYAKTPTPWKPEIVGEIVHLHWISRVIDYPSFFASLPDDLPIVWTLHDMNPLTGGCHYSAGCDQYRSGCGNCPQLHWRGQKDLSQRWFAEKQLALQGKNLHIVAPSQWLTDLAREAPMFAEAKSFQRIPNGFNLQTFRPHAKASARKILGLPKDKVIIGFGAEHLGEHRKGFAELLQALCCLSTEAPVECLVFGAGRIPPDEQLPPIHSLGYVNGANRLALVYSACDLFVLPSLEDNAPQTALEAMACGTPVVAFDAGGVPDYVIPEETGMLAGHGDATELAACMSILIDNRELRQQLGAGARKLIEQDFEQSVMTERYLELYRNISSPAELRRSA
ncbi:glycosyltransferase [Lignipirellula cremea]|uniref:N, N'-diacetylbacillosaminyl-diphospho-undecaprenol alpha-1,3-N-acetylgalactosaminyltransferase n=1 Tax=Lignipirellula cremea TaxID=2528010 RepID=A0A518DUQ4_9BACT|nr:glycosyltransferase [Lignipirellula cremea]QDU95567.1 N,N'-diacetylbacillosaminyl-diphospho-undecaprenol alpha-1,3-N-acetylgalactosaminyltransferase [Lignipirellula cremea]